MSWNYFNPVFESDRDLDYFDSAWAGHRYFAYDLMAGLKPKTVVELGAHRGFSFFAFCQVAKDQDFECSLYAVDTWKGDLHTSYYEEDIFKKVVEVKDKYYSALQISLLRMTFDEAVGCFEDNSIDLLHIDGYHTYEAVSHDFKKWLSKVTDDGVILFHDITETKGDFGVYKLWEELKIKYVTFEFSHSHGLGILLLKSSKIPNHQVFHGIWNNYYSLLHSFHEQRIVNERRMNPLMDRIGALEHEINEKNRVIREKNAEVQKIYNSISWRLTQPVRIIIDILRPARTKL